MSLCSAVSEHLEARVVELEGSASARQRIGKSGSVETTAHATVELYVRSEDMTAVSMKECRIFGCDVVWLL
jgi:hypothetical protein